MKFFGFFFQLGSGAFPVRVGSARALTGSRYNNRSESSDKALAIKAQLASRKADESPPVPGRFPPMAECGPSVGAPTAWVRLASRALLAIAVREKSTEPTGETRLNHAHEARGSILAKLYLLSARTRARADERRARPYQSIVPSHRVAGRLPGRSGRPLTAREVAPYRSCCGAVHSCRARRARAQLYTARSIARAASRTRCGRLPVGGGSRVQGRAGRPRPHTGRLSLPSPHGREERPVKNAQTVGQPSLSLGPD